MQNREFVKRSMKSDLSGFTLKFLLKMNLKDNSLCEMTISNHTTAFVLRNVKGIINSDQ